MDDNELAQLWEKRDRDALILHYQSLVKYVASRMSSTLPPSVEQADLVSYGMFGLIDAIEKFDPERGFKFETYAISRVRGAILDELRSIDWVPRSVRARTKALDVTTARLEQHLRRAPKPEELYAELEVTHDQYDDLMVDLNMVNVTRLDQPYDSEDMSTLGANIPSVTEDPADFTLTDLINRVASFISDCDERERAILALYYYEGLTLAEIGRVLGVTESRVCQIQTKAVAAAGERIQAAEL